MCGRYVTVTKVQEVEKRFGATSNYDPKPTYNAAPSQVLPVITSAESKTIQGFHFGFLPPWAETKHKGLINIKAESILKQGDNSRGYHNLVKGTAQKQRCLIMANCFIEWHKETRQPYVVYVQERRLITFAGLYTSWTDKSTGEVINSFGIVTQPGNALMEKIGHPRQPLILLPEYGHHWLQATTLSDVSAVLNQQISHEYMNAYPIDKVINSPANDGKEVIAPIGERVQPEVNIDIKKQDRLHGMGMSPARRRKLGE